MTAPSRKLRELVYTRDGRRCVECGTDRDLTFGHREARNDRMGTASKSADTLSRPDPRIDSTDRRATVNGTRICSVPECGRPNFARALCTMHWRRWRKNGHTDKVPNAHGQPVYIGCDVTGCDRPHYGKHLCRMHWERNHLNGDPLAVQFERTDSVQTRLAKKSQWVGGCLEFTGGRDKDGYGLLSVRRRNFRAHRLAYEAAFGPIPAGMLVRHKCDNPPCINPDHLEVGYEIDNSRDRVERGRSLPGSTNPSARLNEEQVREIRSQLADGVPSVTLARRYGVGQTTISRIKLGTHWRNVT